MMYISYGENSRVDGAIQPCNLIPLKLWNSDPMPFCKRNLFPSPVSLYPIFNLWICLRFKCTRAKFYFFTEKIATTNKLKFLKFSVPFVTPAKILH